MAHSQPSRPQRPPASNVDSETDVPLGPPVFYGTLKSEAPPIELRHPDSYYSPELVPAERTWVDRYEFLQKKGYEVRERYRPGWVPSWTLTGKSRLLSEDHFFRFHAHIMDAVEINDGAPVVLKRLYKRKKELDITRYLSSPSLSQDPNNHAVQLIETFKDAFNPDIEYLVMPLLRPYDVPEFSVVGEVIDFVTQVLEGLAFIHSHHIAHNDLTDNNIMMDGRSIYPYGWHPISEIHSPDFSGYAKVLSRMDHPVRYLFIDFGFSHRFRPEQRHVVLDYGGVDRDVPELKEVKAYDPFKLDVYTLANTFMKGFYQKYIGVEFLGDLIDYMRVEKPGRRPTAQMSLDFWLCLKKGLDPKQDRWRLRTPNESIPERVVWDAVAAARSSIHGISSYFVCMIDYDLYDYEQISLLIGLNVATFQMVGRSIHLTPRLPFVDDHITQTTMASSSITGEGSRRLSVSQSYTLVIQIRRDGNLPRT